MLRVDGKCIMVGVPPNSVKLAAFSIVASRKVRTPTPRKILSSDVREVAVLSMEGGCFGQLLSYHDLPPQSP